MRVATSAIRRPANSRKVLQKAIEAMLPSIREHGGPLQPPGVIAENDGYRLVWGNTRVLTTLQAGIESIEVYLLPPGTTPEQELEFSLLENHVRTKEDFEDTLNRIEAYAKAAHCSMKLAAEKGGVDPGVISKLKKSALKLGPKVKQLAKEKGVGVSVLYELAATEDHELQLQYLTAHLEGKMSRDQIIQALKKPKGLKKKQPSFQLTIDGIVVAMSFPGETSYEQITSALATLRSQVELHRKHNLPTRLLCEVLK